MRTDRRKISGKKVLPAILTGTVLISVLASGCGKKDQTEDVSSSEQETQSQAIDNTIEWNGKTYTYNRNLTNILFIGVDATDPIGESYEPGSAGQADCIILLSQIGRAHV